MDTVLRFRCFNDWQDFILGFPRNRKKEEHFVKNCLK